MKLDIELLAHIMKCAENWEQKKPMQNFDFMIQKEFDNEDEELK